MSCHLSSTFGRVGVLPEAWASGKGGLCACAVSLPLLVTSPLPQAHGAAASLQMGGLSREKIAAAGRRGKRSYKPTRLVTRGKIVTRLVAA